MLLHNKTLLSVLRSSNSDCCWLDIVRHTEMLLLHFHNISRLDLRFKLKLRKHNWYFLVHTDIFFWKLELPRVRNLCIPQLNNKLKHLNNRVCSSLAQHLLFFFVPKNPWRKYRKNLLLFRRSVKRKWKRSFCTFLAVWNFFYVR